MALDYGELTMELTPEMEKMIKETFNIEIEMIQGERIELPDGRVKYTLKIYDDSKNDIIKEFVLKVISKSHLSNGN